MTPAGRWRARGYWALASVVLPLLNPLVLAVVVVGADTQALSWVVVAIGIVLANFGLLWLVASRIWERGAGCRRRVAAGVVASVALSVVYGYGEIWLFLDFACPESGCLS